jgi:Cof subfamily protein (haloacid dehalogenase superfamily)
MIQMIFSDIDGTLINDQLVVTEKTRQSLLRAHKQRCLIVPVSARMPKAIQPILDGFLPTFPIISYNGALIQDEQGRKLFSHGMKKEDVLSICHQVANTSGVVWNVYSGDSWYSQTRQNSWVLREEEVVGLQSYQAELTEIEQLFEIHKLLLMGDSEAITELEKSLTKSYPHLSIAKSFPYYLEIMAAGIQKGQAVSRLADHYGIDLVDTIAFGDNFNDLDMLLAVGQGFVMENGPEAVRQRVGQTTASHNHDGIALVINQYFTDK